MLPDEAVVARRLSEVLRGLGFESPDFICCVWHGNDLLSVLSLGVPRDHLSNGLRVAAEALDSQSPIRQIEL